MTVSTTTLARRWFEEVWNQGRNETLEELLSPTCEGFMVGHGAISGVEQFKAIWARFLEAFPDLHVRVEDVVTEGDKVVVRWAARATHAGHGLGVAPTGSPCAFRGLTWLEFRAGKVERGWDAWDLGGLIQQLQPPARGQA